MATLHKRLFYGIYTLGMHVVAFATLVRWGWRLAREGGKVCAQGFYQRLGRGLPSWDARGGDLVWVHAVSVGETLAVAGLVQALKAKLPNSRILVSSITETGHQIAQQKIAADAHIYLPLDLPYIIRPLVRRWKPRLLVICETDFWYHLQDAVQQEGGRVCLVNGKLSARSFMRWKWWPQGARTFFSSLDLLCVQNTTYQQRFRDLGVDAARMHVVGNLKEEAVCSFVDEGALRAVREAFCLRGPVVTLGSTHAPEEQLWLEQLACVWGAFPQTTLFLVPRHPERCGALEALLQEQGLAYVRWSAKGCATPVAVVLVDVMGVLPLCYQLATVAFVGGSLTPKVGGHNVLEPCFYGVPVLFGPHMEGQKELRARVLEHGAGKEIAPSALGEEVAFLLSHPARAAQFGAQGKLLTAHTQGGVVQKTMEKIYVAASH